MLPTEIHRHIARDLVNPRDVARSIKDLRSLRLANKHFKNVAEGSVDPEKIVALSQHFDRWSYLLRELPIPQQPLNSTLVTRLYLSDQAAYIALRGVDDRRVIVDEILRHSYDDIGDALHNLIANIEQVAQDQRHDIVNYTLGVERPYENFGDLIDKAEHLGADERSRVVLRSCSLQDDTERRRSLTFWADKINLLEPEEQSRILEATGGEGAFKGPILAHYAKHVSKLSASNRASLFQQINALPVGATGKWEGLRYLSEHLPSLHEEDAGRVAAVVMANFHKPIAEPSDPAVPWNSRADLCKIEALHQLSVHRELLDPRVREQIDVMINQTIARASAPVQAQLITHLRREHRESVVLNAFNQNDPGIMGPIVNALTVRVRDFREDERGQYITIVQSHFNRGSEFALDLVEYNIQNNLEYFNVGQRTTLINKELELVHIEEPEYASWIFADIAKNAKYLRDVDVNSTILIARDFLHHNVGRLPIDPNTDASIKACAGIVMRCVTNWAAEALSPVRIAAEQREKSHNVPGREIGVLAGSEATPSAKGKSCERSSESAVIRCRDGF